MDFMDNQMMGAEVVERSLNVRLRLHRAKENLKYGTLSVVLFAALWYDLSSRCPAERSLWYMLECAGLFVLSWSILVCFLRYLFYTLFTSPACGTEEQRCLLSIDETDGSFETVGTDVEDEPDTTNIRTSSPMDGIAISWTKLFREARAVRFSSWTPNRTASTAYQGYGMSYYTPNVSVFNKPFFNRTPFKRPVFSKSFLNMPMINRLSVNGSPSKGNTFNSPSFNLKNTYTFTPKNDPIIPDRRGLDGYLRDYDKRSYSMCDIAYDSRQSPFRPVNSFWNCYNSTASLLRTSLYQLSPPTSPSTPSKQSSITEEKNMSINDLTVIKRAPSDRLSQDVANLRMWISSTILMRLAREFQYMDESFQSRGFGDMRIGNIGLERLKKTAENQQFVNTYMPRLPLILPFLEMSSNQEYLVQRIKDLAKGSCIADFRWNSGASYHEMEWDEHLPSDSAIIFHLFCVYIDSQLVPLPQGGGRPFYNRYVIEGDEKRSLEQTMAEIKNRANCAILCVNRLKPLFNFITTTEVHNAAYDCNNLFYVIIQFLIYLRAHHNSALEGVNLGRSGINIMCVIDD